MTPPNALRTAECEKQKVIIKPGKDNKREINKQEGYEHINEAICNRR